MEPCSLLDLAPRKCRWPIGGRGYCRIHLLRQHHRRRHVLLRRPCSHGVSTISSARSGRLASVITVAHTSVPAAHPPVASEGIEQFRRTSA